MKHLLFIFLLALPHSLLAGVSNWVDFELEGGHVKIPVKVAGIETYAVLDSGSQINGVGEDFIKQFKPNIVSKQKFRIKGMYGTELKPSYNNVDIEMFGFSSEMDELIEMSMGSPSKGLLLGAPFFNNMVVQLDYPNKKMRLLTRDSIDIDDYANIEMKREESTGMPMVRVRLPEDRSIWLLFDTGNSSGIVVKRSIASKFDWLENNNKQVGTSSGINKEIETENFRIPAITFGPYELENVLVTIPAEGEAYRLDIQHTEIGTRLKGHRVQGLIGYDVFKHFLITLDYRRGKAHIGLPDA
jgi:hypothetical protein